MGNPISTLLGLKAAGTLQLAQIAVLRKSHQMEMAMLQMLDDATKLPPAPAGQGHKVDKRA